jgi:hypothetical protein
VCRAGARKGLSHGRCFYSPAVSSLPWLLALLSLLPLPSFPVNLTQKDFGQARVRIIVRLNKCPGSWHLGNAAVVSGPDQKWQHESWQMVSSAS